MEELQLERETSASLVREQQAMMLELTTHARWVYSRLSGKNLGLPDAFQAASPANHAHFYLSKEEHLEEAAGEVDCGDPGLAVRNTRLWFTQRSPKQIISIEETVFANSSQISQRYIK